MQYPIGYSTTTPIDEIEISMRTRTLRVIFETGESAGEAVILTAELVLYEDGTLTGSGLLSAGRHASDVAATGTHEPTLGLARVVRRR